jgi:hypothetical protein
LTTFYGVFYEDELPKGTVVSNSTNGVRFEAFKASGEYELYTEVWPPGYPEPFFFQGYLSMDRTGREALIPRRRT